MTALWPNKNAIETGRFEKSSRPLRAFTLVELLVVIAVLGVLLAMLAPSIGAARRYARLIKAHAELRGICIAIEAYAYQNNDKIPPTRTSCATRTFHQLPVELAREDYLPIRKGAAPAAYVEDAFNPGQTYRYLAPGPTIINESTYFEKKAQIWVPDDFPHCRSEKGQFYRDPRRSPVRYAVWSQGPDPSCEKFDDKPYQKPLPRRFWMTHVSEEGVITHFRDKNGGFHASP